MLLAWRPATRRASAWLLATSVMLAAACGFDGIGSGGTDASTPNGGDAGGDAADGNVTIQIDPDASIKPGCGSPSLQAGAPWAMLGGCVTHSGRSVFRGPHKVPRELWSGTVTTDHPIPSIGADGTIYVPGTGSGIVAFSPDGGSRTLDVGGGNVVNVPLIGVDGTLHAGAGSFVVAHRPDGGNLRYDLTDSVRTSAVLDADGNVYMSSLADKLVSLGPDGKFRWELDTGADVKSSAAIGPNGDIYVGSLSNKLYAVGKDGTKHWEYDTGADIESSPVIADDGTVYIGTKDSKLHAVLPVTGTQKWIYAAPGDFDWQVLPALGADGTIYAGVGSKVVAVRPDGTELWKFDAQTAVRTPIIVDADGIVFFGADSTQFFALTPDGKLLWQVGVGNIPYGFAIGRDGTMYVTCDGDKIHALRE